MLSLQPGDSSTSLPPGARAGLSLLGRRRGCLAVHGALAAIVIAAALVAVPRPASAAACCISATSFGVGRLLVWEDWAAGVQLGHARSLGQWDAGGKLRWNDPGFSDGLSRLEPWAIVRALPRLELHARVPVVVNDRRSGGEGQVAGGLGDVGAGARVEVLGVGEYAGLPSLALTLSGIAPTGRRVEETSPPLFAGATGRGAWGGAVAVEAEYALLPWFVRVEGGLTAFLPFRRADTGVRQAYGRIATAGLSAGREVAGGALVLAAAATGEWEAPLSLAGARVSGSAAQAFSLAGSLSWRADPRWTLVGSVTNTVWPDGGGTNRDARLGFTLGVRHGHF